jgi:uncharacterized membrane protein HdeD (DUF308 family)
MSGPARFHRGATRVFSLLMLAIGIALLVQAFAGSSGSTVIRLVLAVLFIAAGIGRLYAESRRASGGGPR